MSYISHFFKYSYSEQKFKTSKMDSGNFENSGDIDESLMPFVIAPQRRRHSLWLPSPLNSINSVEPGVVSYDPSKDKVFKFRV